MADGMLDSHHHFWRYAPDEYPWIDEGMAVLRRDYLRADLRAARVGTAVNGLISVQARRTVGETAFLLEQAAETPEVVGVVGWVPLADEDVGPMIERFAADPLLVGVREVTQGEPEAAFFGDRAFNRGLEEVTRRGLVYDLLIYEDQLPAAIRLVDRHPDQRFVLDHIGKPAISGRAPGASWRDGIRRLAERPHVACKWSGVVTEVRDGGWDAERLRPYFDEVWSAFGAERVMFGSDWPVCLLSATYREWVDTVDALAAPLAAEERRAFFSGTARRWYRLDGRGRLRPPPVG